MQELLDTFTTLHRNAALGGSEKAREKHVARGKMLVRE
jgi:3-methylcrotonyl-CoA carboxylase beta subunit